MAVSRNKAQEILEPHRNLLVLIVTSGFADYLSLLEHMPQSIKARTVANLIYDFIEAHAKELLVGIDGIKLLECKGLFLAVVADTLVLRFKKFDNNKMASNIPTQQATDYKNQDLPNFPQHTTLFVGYELDKLKTKIEEITVACPNGESNLWNFNLDSDTGADILELPLDNSPAPIIPIKVKKTANKKRIVNE